MTYAFYLLAVSALLFYVNTNTVGALYRWQKNLCWYGAWVFFALSLIAVTITLR